jgi:hypothetical protein
MVGIVWMIFGQHDGLMGTGVHILWPEDASTADMQIPALLAHGITLAHPEENANLSQQEALLIASQREPDALSARSVSSRYALVNSTMAQKRLQNTPAWVICYQNIAASTGGVHDLYIFLDANSGTELFALRT